MMDSILRKIILKQVLVRALTVLAVFVALCVAAHAAGAFVTKAPVKVTHCHRHDMNNPVARALHPECVRYEA